MKKPLPLFFGSTLFVCGLLVGIIANSGSRAQTPRVDQNPDTRLLTSTLAAETGVSIACLNRLRTGATSTAIEVLELHTDANLVNLANRLSILPASEREPQHLEAIKMFRDYREKFPCTNTLPYIQQGITRAYGLLAPQKGGH